MKDNATALLPAMEQDVEPVTATVSLPPMSYTQLRLLAECTAALDTSVDFVFTPDQELTVTTDPGNDEVLIPVYEEGKYPQNVVKLYVHRPPQGEEGHPMKLQGRFADAIFWSDASVEKFLIPYVASCAGVDASRMVARLQAAWNFFPQESVHVYALAHVVAYEDGAQLSLDHAIQVVYGKPPLPGADADPKLKLLPVGKFLEEYPPEYPVDAKALQIVEYHRGVDVEKLQRPGYLTLRALAEYACSLCHEPQYFLLKEGENGFGPPSSTLPEMGSGDYVIPAFTPSVPAQRHRLHGVECYIPDTEPDYVPAEADAVFWSDGAVEQFLYPYYASKRGLQQGLAELMTLTTVWTGRFPDLVQGAGPVRSFRVNGGNPVVTDVDVIVEAEAAAEAAGDFVMAREGGDDEPRVNALVHMPTSEWLPQIETLSAQSPLNEMGVIFQHRGRTRSLSVNDFLARFPRKGRK
jgi:hypothetical protein